MVDSKPFWGLGAGVNGILRAPLWAAGGAALPGTIISQPVSTSAIRTAPGAPTATQFQEGDELRNFAVGYDNINSAETRRGNALTGVAGSYTNKATGHTINYVADALGFRIVGLGGRKKRSILAGPATILSAPATRDATRMNIQYNPGFAYGYIVY